MVSEKFRYQLRQEVEQWRSENLIDVNLYEQLAQRYQFSTLDTASRNRFILILLGLGSVLLGLAVITFVAANWQIWSREVKVVLLLSLFVSINSAGFYLWRRPTERWQTRAGQGLLLLGALLLGANMALMSQMFHQSGRIYELLLVWGLGVLAMAYSLRLTLLAVLAVILTALGYCFGIPHLYYLGQASSFQFVLQHMPLLASALFIPLAYGCRSRWLFGLSALLVVASLETNLLFLMPRLFDDETAIAEGVAALTCTLVPALLWAYRDSLWERSTSTFDPIARGLAVTFLCILFYILSFRGLWQGSPIPGLAEIPPYAWSPLFDVLLLGGLTLYSWWKLGYQRGSIWRIDLSSTAVGVMILATGLLVWWHGRVEPLGAIAIFICNVLLFLLAIGLVRESLGTGQRKGFWLGITLMVLQLTSRMLEYKTGLLFKAIVLFLCGVGVILAGLWFERYIRTLPSDRLSVTSDR
jgi:uncharacterized membrane protein